MSMVNTVGISGLSVPERVALMERLWETLSAADDGPEPPDWHAQVLREREAEWGQRHSLSEDWEKARAELRQALPCQPLRTVDRYDPCQYESYPMTDETVVTSKGTSTIPLEIRRKAGIGTGTIIRWTIEPDGLIVVRKKAGELDEAQRHVRARAGLWDGRVSGAELLRRTRP